MSAIRALLPLLVLLAVGCGRTGEPGAPPPAGVNVAEVVQKKVREWDDFTGRLEAPERVEIRPRVSGYLAAVAFEEGALVKAGDLLFRIDDREYRAAVSRAEAEVARAEATSEAARSRAQRAGTLREARAISVEDADTRVAEHRQAQAAVQAARAALETARIDLGFTRITAPSDGRVSRALVRPGNLVQSGGGGEPTLLTTLVSVDPLHVVFEGDERIYLKYQRLNRSGLRPSSREASNPVMVALADESDYPHAGHMDFVDNAIDPATGTIIGRAVIPNPDGDLTPGMFVRVKLLGSGEYEALLIHERAVMTDQDRRYVYVVGEGDTALRKDVVLGARIDGLRVVESGLSAGDRVVVNGTQKIFFPGMPLQATLVPMDDPERAPPAAATPATGG
jgi:multidrug efflux system membrane fusion protein